MKHRKTASRRIIMAAFWYISVAVSRESVNVGILIELVGGILGILAWSERGIGFKELLLGRFYSIELNFNGNLSIRL